MNLVNENQESDWAHLVDNMVSSKDFWDAKLVPERIWFQRFGVQLREEDFEQLGTAYRGFLIRDRSAVRKASSGFSDVRNGDRKFVIDLDVWPFKWDELLAVVIPKYYLIINGEHPEKCEDNNICTRKFTRRYPLPKGCLPDTMMANYFNFTLRIVVDKDESAKESPIARKVNITRGDPFEMDARAAFEQCRKVPIINEDLESYDQTADNTTTESSQETSTEDDSMSDRTDENTSPETNRP